MAIFYTRQDTADAISNDKPTDATVIDAEFDAIVAAFASLNSTPLFFDTRADAVAATVGSQKFICVNGLWYQQDNGNVNKALTTADSKDYVPIGYSSPRHFAENTTPGTTDMTTAVQAAYDYAAATYGINVKYDGAFKVTSTINFNQSGSLSTTVIEGTGADSYLLVAHESGPGIHISKGGHVLRDFGVIGGNDRAAASQDKANPGILVEAADSVSTLMSNVVIQNVTTRRHNGSGIVLNHVTNVILDNITSTDNRRHAYVIGNQDESTRTNKDHYTGIVDLRNSRCGSDGYNFLVGAPNNIPMGASVFRVRIHSLDDNGGPASSATSGMSYRKTGAWFRADNSEIVNSALGAGDTGIEALAVSGSAVRVEGCRLIETQDSDYGIRVFQYSTNITEGIEFFNNQPVGVPNEKIYFLDQSAADGYAPCSGEAVGIVHTLNDALEDIIADPHKLAYLRTNDLLLGRVAKTAAEFTPVASGLLSLPPHGVAYVTGEGGVDDTVTDIRVTGLTDIPDGFIAHIINGSDLQDITIKHNSGSAGTNIICRSDIVLTSNNDILTFRYRAGDQNEWNLMTSSLAASGMDTVVASLSVEDGPNSAQASAIRTNLGFGTEQPLYFDTRAEAVAASTGARKFVVADGLRYRINPSTSNQAFTSADGHKYVPDGDIYALHFGALEDYDRDTDTGTNDATAIQAAINYMLVDDTVSGGKLHFRKQSMVNATITVPGNIEFVPIVPATLEGSVGQTTYPITDAHGSGIIGNHTNGPVIWFSGKGGKIADGFTIGATETRYDAGLGTGITGRNCGVLFYNSGSDRASGCNVGDNVLVMNQPAEGVWFCSTVSNCHVGTPLVIYNCKSHAVVVDNGHLGGIAGDVLYRPGIMKFGSIRASTCGGQALVIGHPDAGTNIPYRITLEGIESIRCGNYESHVFDPTSAVNTTTDIITITGHGYSNGDMLIYSAGDISDGDAVIGGLAQAGVYYVVGATTDTFQLSATSGGAAINLTSTGTGTTHLVTNTERMIPVSTNKFAPAYVRGEQITVINSAHASTSGYTGDTAIFPYNWAINVEHMRFSECRFIRAITAPVLIFECPITSGHGNYSIKFENCHVANSNASAEDYFFNLDSGASVRDIYVWGINGYITDPPVNVGALRSSGSTGTVWWNGEMEQIGGITTDRLVINKTFGGELTIASGVITVTNSNVIVDTEADAATDDLVTINGGVDEQLLILRTANSGRTVVLKDGTGNLNLGADITLDANTKHVILMYNDNTSEWFCIGKHV